MSGVGGWDYAGAPGAGTTSRRTAGEGILFYGLFVPLALYLPRYGLYDLSAFWVLSVAAFVTLTRRARFEIAGRWELLGLFLLLFLVASLATVNGVTTAADLGPTAHAFYLFKTAKNLLVAYAIVLIVQRVPIDLRALMAVLFLSLLANLVVVFLQIAFFDFQTWTMGIFQFGGGGTAELRTILRGHGMTMAYNSAAMLVVLLSICILYWFHQAGGVGKQLLLLVALLASCVGFFLTARVGVVTAACVALLYGVLTWKRVLTVRNLFSLLFVIFVVAFFLVRVLDLRGEVELVSLALSRLSVEMFVKDIGVLLVSATKISQDPLTWFIGTGAPPWTSIGAHTDNGYGQIFWQGGVAGVFLSVVILVYIALSRVGGRLFRRTVDERQVLLLFIFAILVASVKANYFFTRSLFETVMLVWAATGRIPLRNEAWELPHRSTRPGAR